MNGRQTLQSNGGRKTFFYPAGTPYGRIAEDFPGQQDCPALLVASNGRLRELHKPLREDCTLEYITIKDEIGYMAYRRSVTLLMLAAVRRVAERTGQGWFCIFPRTAATTVL